ncbi:hypothetical protein ALI22I_32760 [Saccharothrix sp. ALI-22-I]|uniref:hypothetical protein n=1 Tax=Saccharothrix sp. ALI-22-I TaxID=1933778 RepID=UPI00097C442C|nr:hypothetical protein [Saccharothrix sp. ALI-22-I]ONI83309.1 hypothetical protein ALI22I_32760 [Saccharothrix sp. ALI-22-I]
MTSTDPKLVAEIDAIEDEIVDVATDTVTEPVDGGGEEPTGGPYKPTDDPLVKPMGGPYKPTGDPLVKPMGGPYKPTGDPETNGGPYKPTTDEPAAATQTR